MNKKPNGKLGVKLVALIDQRNKIAREYAVNHRARLKLQCDLDRLTTQIAQLAGLEPSAYVAGGWLDPMKSERV